LTEKKDKPLPILIVSGLIVFLVMLQPDLGMSVVILTTGFVVYFISGAPLWHLLLLGVVGIVSGLGLVFSSPYRKERFLTFLNPFRDPLGSSYHIRQILIALGSGGLFGLGLGQSRQKYEYIPAVATDSVFAVIAEELGFIGASFLLFVYLFLIFRAFKIAQKAPDQFSQLLVSGVITWIGVQTMINLAAMVALVPLTGMPLPFISYGGSSLLLALIGMGIIVNISFYT
jgi:cell division protein FtsW